MNDQDNIFTDTRRLLEGTVSPQLQTEGQSVALGRSGLTLPHYPVKDTALAACLATLDIPLRDPAPFTKDVALDEHANERGQTTVWWLADRSRTGDANAHKTEELLSAWTQRQRFEKDHPLHPLVHMRAAIDAREFWVKVIAAYQERLASLPVELEAGTKFYETESIHGACVLKACGFKPLGFNRRTFFLQPVKDGVTAQKLLLMAALNEGQAPVQWMARVLKNFSHMLSFAKDQSTILRHAVAPGQTLLLTADATRKTVDKFRRLL